MQIPEPPDPPFKALRTLACPEGQAFAGWGGRLSLAGCERFFPGDNVLHRLARALASRAAVDTKEFVEAVEFHERVRGRLKAPVVADLCCGHGLVGLLFALLDRPVERVLLVDKRRPASHDVVLDAFQSLAPWITERVTFFENRLSDVRLPPKTSVVGVHACGVRTDYCLDQAIEARGALAVMPCCYARTSEAAPRAVRERLGHALAADIHRTYRLTAAGFTVDWSGIPRAVSGANRILIATCDPSDRRRDAVETK